MDVQVDLEQNSTPLEEAMETAGNEDLTIEIFPKANHLFQEAVTGAPEEYSSLSNEFIPGFLETITSWLHAQIELDRE